MTSFMASFMASFMNDFVKSLMKSFVKGFIPIPAFYPALPLDKGDSFCIFYKVSVQYRETALRRKAIKKK